MVELPLRRQPCRKDGCRGDHKAQLLLQGSHLIGEVDGCPRYGVAVGVAAAGQRLPCLLLDQPGGGNGELAAETLHALPCRYPSHFREMRLKRPCSICPNSHARLFEMAHDQEQAVECTHSRAAHVRHHLRNSSFVRTRNAAQHLPKLFRLPKDLAMRLLPALSVTAECHPKFRKLARYKCSEPHLISYKHRLWCTEQLAVNFGHSRPTQCSLT
mmetsp:Transcript_10410/g.18856  ORF Transcript_10410/g.18856 Transcript_10410/m.18856 type:complete len:214 (+) Transcript_10410:964-1605(+)